MNKIIYMFLLSVMSLYAYEELNISNFENKIKGKNVIVDFYAPWCPPCKIMAENLQDYSSKKAKNIEIYKVNVDDELELAKKYGVSYLPTIIYFKDGKMKKDYIGVMDIKELTEASKENFK